MDLPDAVPWAVLNKSHWSVIFMDFSLITYFLPLHDSAVLSALAEFFTILAEDTIIILVGAFLYWCVDPKAGQRMAAVAVGGVFWTLGLKNFIKVPRPWDLGIIRKEQAIRAHTATGYSFPSGHTTAAVNIYGYFAMGAKKAVKLLLWALVALVGLSRIFLGCHTSYDVLAALVISIAWIYLGSFLFDKLMAKGDANIFWFAIPMGFAAISLFTGIDDDIVKMCAFGGAALIGIYVERRAVHFTPFGGKGAKALQYVLGLLVVVALKFWPYLIGEAFYETLWLKAIDYALIALWLSCGYPYLLEKYRKNRAS